MFPSHSASLVGIGATAALVLLPFAAVPAEVPRTATSQPARTAVTQRAETAAADSRALQRQAARVIKSRAQVVDGVDEAGMSPYGRLARMAATGRLDAALERARDAGGSPLVLKVAPSFRGADDGTTLPGGQADMSIAVDASGNNVVVVFNDGQGLALSPVSASGFAWSGDGGVTFTVGDMLPSPQQGTFGGAAYPQVFGNPDVKYVPGGSGCQFVVASVLVTGVNGTGTAPNIAYGGTAQTLAIHRSVDCGHTWSGPFELTSATNPTGVLVGSSARDVADRPSIDVDQDTGRVVASWSNFTSTTVIGGGVEIRTAFSDNVMSGVLPTWSIGTVANGGSADFDTGSMVRFAGNGSANAYIAWERKSNNPAAATPYGGEACGNTMFARSTDNGATWSTPVKLHTGGICVGGDFWPIDQIPGNDRVHSHPAIAVDTSAGPASGNVYVVYTANDAKDGGDVHFVRSVNGGTSFSAPVRLNARPGVDRSQWFPSTIVAPTGRLYVIWYDQQSRPTGDMTETMMTFSDDAGNTWTRPAALTERPFHAGYGNDTSQPNLGERIGAASHGDTLYAAWAGNPRDVGFTDGQLAPAWDTVPRLLFRRTNVSQPSLMIDVTAARAVEVVGKSNGNGALDPGETIEIHLPLTNFVTNAAAGAGGVGSVAGTLSTAVPGVALRTPVQSYGAIASGSTVTSAAPFVILLQGYVPRGPQIDFKLTVATDQGTVTLPFALEIGTRMASTVLTEDFVGEPEGSRPQFWLSVHEGGATTVPWVKHTGFCGASGLFQPNTTAATDATRYERLLSTPFLTWPSPKFQLTTLELRLCYETEDDPDFNVLAYDGLTVGIVDRTTGRVTRPVLAEAFAMRIATGSGPLAANHFPKHLPRSGDPAYLQDMSVWAGSSGGMKTVVMDLPGMEDGAVQFFFDYTQDRGGTCTDAGHSGSPPGTCGVLLNYVRVQAIEFGASYAAPYADVSFFPKPEVSPATVTPGGTVEYRYCVVADGLSPFSADDVVFTDPLPGATRFLALLEIDNDWACTLPPIGAGGTVSCIRQGLRPGEMDCFTIAATVPITTAPGTSCVNEATVTSSSPQRYPQQYYDGVAGPCVVGSGTDLAVTATAPVGASAGGEIDYRFGVANLGPIEAQAVSLAFVMPTGTTLQSFSQTLGPAFGCTVPPAGTTGTVTCTTSALAGNVTAEFALKVKVDGALAGTLIVGSVIVSTTTPEASLANNVASPTTLVSSAMLVASIDGTGAGIVTSSPAGLHCPATCSAPFASSSTVRLNAAASAGSVFTGWSGACTGTGACPVTMNKAQAVTATFAADANSHVVTVTPTGSGTGHVDSVPSGIGCGVACAASFASGSTVTLTAATDMDAVFVGWTGACSGIGACTLTVSAARSVGAEFAVAGAMLEATRFDADAKADLVWRSASSGATLLTLMDGPVPRVSSFLQVPAAWAVTHAGDFDGDGKSDLLWHNASAAETAVWIMDGTHYIRGQSILASPGWSVTHVADFDGDRKADLLWRNAWTGEVAVWLMDGPAYVRGSILLAEPLWSVAHVGDFNADGRSDLVWRNATTGETALWLMDGIAATSGGIVLASTPWEATAVGDFDGDGKSDLVWRNAGTGETAVWLMDGIRFGSGAIVTASAPWAVTHVADLDGDRRSDLVWRNGATGATVVWLMNGTSRGASAVFADAPDWLVRRTADLNGDGKADIVWRNRVNDFTGVWLMDGTVPIDMARPLWPNRELVVQ